MISLSQKVIIKLIFRIYLILRRKLSAISFQDIVNVIANGIIYHVFCADVIFPAVILTKIRS